MNLEKKMTENKDSANDTENMADGSCESYESRRLAWEAGNPVLEDYICEKEWREEVALRGYTLKNVSNGSVSLLAFDGDVQAGDFKKFIGYLGYYGDPLYFVEKEEISKEAEEALDSLILSRGIQCLIGK